MLYTEVFRGSEAVKRSVGSVVTAEAFDQGDEECQMSRYGESWVSTSTHAQHTLGQVTCPSIRAQIFYRGLSASPATEELAGDGEEVDVANACLPTCLLIDPVNQKKN